MALSLSRSLTRSPQEIAFRIRQELNNLCLFITPPRLACGRDRLHTVLPHRTRVVERVRGSGGAAETVGLADGILKHSFPLLGVKLDAGQNIDWRRDYLRGRSTGTIYFRRIPYLDCEAVGDHKIIWELNRHQHLVLLAQAYCLTGRSDLIDEIVRQLDSWLAENPFPRGINWTSALEVAFRALSWVWILHLVGDHLPRGFRMDLATGLYRHALHLERNLSIYFSPNTHLLGEAVTLHAVGAMFPDFPGASRFRRKGRDLAELQMEMQVRNDGSHFEQSTYYHVYAFDFFLLHSVLAETTLGYKHKLARMADYLDTLLGPSRQLPLLGDDDGGRVFHPYGVRSEFGRASLATCSCLLGEKWSYRTEDLYPQAMWWLGERAIPPARTKAASAKSRFFPDSGVLVMTQGAIQVICDAGPFGAGSAGHSHSDTLSLTIRRGSQDILVDPGTYCYMGDAAARNWFRGSSAHNTIRIDGQDQGTPAGPFRWSDVPSVEVAAAGPDFLDASCSYRGFVHRRRIQWLRAKNLLFVLDDITGLAAEHAVEQFWHPGGPITVHSPRCLQIAPNTTMSFTDTVELLNGWRSTVLYDRTPTTVICVRRSGHLPMRLAAAIDFSGNARGGLRMITDHNGVHLECAGSGEGLSFLNHVAPKHYDRNRR